LKVKQKKDLKRIEALTKKELKFILPLPPSVNHMYYNTGRGGKRLTKTAEEYVRTATSLINLATKKNKWEVEEDGNWYYVDMVFYMPDLRIRDSHNMLKLLFDVLQPRVFGNDYFAMPRINSVELDKENPRIEIKIHSQLADERKRFIK